MLFYVITTVCANLFYLKIKITKILTKAVEFTPWIKSNSRIRSTSGTKVYLRKSIVDSTTFPKIVI